MPLFLLAFVRLSSFILLLSGAYFAVSGSFFLTTLFLAFFSLIHLGIHSYWFRKAHCEDRVLLRIRPARLSEKNPAVMEQVFSALHFLKQGGGVWETLSGKPHISFSFEIASYQGSICFFARMPRTLFALAKSQLYAHYPEIEMETVLEYLPLAPTRAVGTELRLMNADIFPIRRHSQFEDKTAKVITDPLSGILHPLSGLLENETTVIQIACQPLPPRRFRKLGSKCLRIISAGTYSNSDVESACVQNLLILNSFQRFLRFPLRLWFFLRQSGTVSSGKSISLDMEMNRNHDRENELTAASDKLSRLPFLCSIRIVAFGEDPFLLEQKTEEIVGAFRQFNMPQLNGFEASSFLRKPQLLARRLAHSAIRGQMVLNNEELATVFHLPTKTVETPDVLWVSHRKFEPPKNLPIFSRHAEATALGKTNFRGNRHIFGILPDDRRRHVYIVGKTGMGKSTLLENMIFSDIQAGKGIAVIDPHGDLAEEVIGFVPSSRTNDVMLFDPSDSEFPVSFNILECPNPNNRHLVASGVIGVLKKMFSESWGPRLEHVLRNTLLALIEADGTTLLGVLRMLGEAEYREEILAKVHDPLVLGFWKNEFGKWSPKQVTEAASPIQNKVGQFLSASLVRNILGQTKSSIDLRFAMDKGKIIIINLSKGKIGEDNSALLGSLLVTKFQLDVMSRADTLEKDRRDFYLYVDEFQNFATDSFATILSEARKYRLNLVVANQYLAQMEETVRDAIFGNVGTMLTFQVGFDDAETLSDQFGGEDIIAPADIGSLPKYEAYLRLMIDGMPSSVFSVSTLPPPEFEHEEGRTQKILKACRQRYGRPRAIVEERIIKWSMNQEKKEGGGKRGKG